MGVLSRVRSLWSHSLVRNSAWMLGGHMVRVGTQGGYFVLAARTLGPDGLGVFAGVLALAKIMLPFASLGAEEVLVQRTARDRSDYPEALGNALLITSVIGLLLTGLCALVSDFIFGGKASLKLVLLVAISELVLYRLQILVRRVFQAVDDLRVTAFVKGIYGPALAAAIVGFALFSPDKSVDAWGYWYLLAIAVPSVGALVYMLIKLERPVFRPRAAMSQLVDGFFFSLSESAKTAYTDADKMLLLRLQSKEIAGVYKAGYRVLSVLMAPVLALLDAAYARFFKTGAQGIAGAFDFARKLLRFSVVYGLVLAGGIWLTAPLLPWLLGPKYEASVEVLRWLAPIPVIQSFSYMLMQALTGAGRQRARGIIQFAAAILNVGLNLVLIPLYTWKAAAGSAVVTEAFVLIAVYLLCRKLDTEERGAGSTESRAAKESPAGEDPVNAPVTPSEK